MTATLPSTIGDLEPIRLADFFAEVRSGTDATAVRFADDSGPFGNFDPLTADGGFRAALTILLDEVNNPAALVIAAFDPPVLAVGAGVDLAGAVDAEAFAAAFDAADFDDFVEKFVWVDGVDFIAGFAFGRVGFTGFLLPDLSEGLTLDFLAALADDLTADDLEGVFAFALPVGRLTLLPAASFFFDAFATEYPSFLS